MEAERIFAARHVVTPDGVRPAWIHVAAGKVVAVRAAPPPPAVPVEDFGERWLLPGLVDTHVHVNEPGRAEWEGFDTATAAAAAGGICTIVDMPLNSIPATTSAAALRVKRDAAERAALRVDVAFWGGVVPGNTRELPELAAHGACGFKCFLVPSGVDEFPCVGESDLDEAMPVIAALELPLLVHAELPAPIDAAHARLAGADPRRHATWLESRPAAAEVEAIRLVLRLAERHGCRVHVVHLATGEALDDLRRARARGVAVTAETCPHYLTLGAEEIVDGATPFKCAPPIRERAERERLWGGLRDGVIDLVASDHSPCPPALKRLDTGDFLAAWGGIASLELSLAAVWTAARARGFGLEDTARWMSLKPARLAGLETRKGAIAPGRDADFVVFEPDVEWEVDGSRLRQRHAITPYAGRRLRGVVAGAWLRGEQIALEPGAASAAHGVPLARPAPRAAARPR